jgi:hypothetical protein
VRLAEVIDVEQQQGDRAAPVERAQHQVAAGHQRRPVEQAGELIVHGVVGDPLLERGHPLVHRRIMQRPTECVAVRRDRGLVARHRQGRLGQPDGELADDLTGHRHRPGDRRTR